MSAEARTFKLVVVNAGTGDPSSTRLLVDRVAGRTAAIEKAAGNRVELSVVSLRELAKEISVALTSQLIGSGLAAAVERLGAADGVVAGAPVHKAGASGLFTSFFGALDNDLLIGKPVVLAATAGTARHALVVDHDMRPLFAYLRALVAPTSVFASTEDWADRSLDSRIDRAATELALMMESDFARRLKETAWGSYQHEYGSAGGQELSVDFDSDLMRLATGGHRPSGSEPPEQS